MQTEEQNFQAQCYLILPLVISLHSSPHMNLNVRFPSFSTVSLVLNICIKLLMQEAHVDKVI